MYLLNTKDIAPPDSAELLQSHAERGQAKFLEFSQDLENNMSFFYEPIKKNKADHFEKNSSSGEHSKPKAEDCKLFSKLFMSCQT